jgi:5'-phosphate synthase pdxT subunit
MIGILALQGDYFAHGRVLDKLGRKYIYVKTPAELALVDSLIMPGGESTTMLKLAKANGLWDELKAFRGPIMGTCAGLILLAKKIENPPEESLGLLDVTIARNGYGSQINSFTAQSDYLPGNEKIEAVFIRAPRIISIGPDVETIVRLKEEPIGVRQNNIIALTFHPELTHDITLHQLFVGLNKTVARTALRENI